jgi:hypothetical protein
LSSLTRPTEPMPASTQNSMELSKSIIQTI